VAAEVADRRLLDFPKPVWLLGWVSLATDVASEAIYPLLPFFLTRVLSAGAISVGIVEGAAEAANSILKIASGRVADRSKRKRPLVLLGYSVSSAARPLIALATTWTQVFTIRVLDRVGKGVRGAPRDAMLATWADPSNRGRVYGFHRSMDHFGAVVGPALASLFLVIFPEQYRWLFGLTIIPGAIAVALILLVREKRDTEKRSGLPLPSNGTSQSTMAASESRAPFETRAEPNCRVASGLRSATGNSSPDQLPRRFYWFMGVLTLFALGNSTDAFLLLKLTDAAGSARFVPLMWAALHVVKAIVSVLAGSWSDRVGRRTVIAIGWLVYAVVYGGFAVSSTLAALLVWFMVYGFYFGFAEGTEKALVTDLAPASRRGVAFGVYNAVTGLGALAASIVFGEIWNAFGAPSAFALGAAIAIVATALLFVVVPAARPTVT
jgi:MFS family permease